MKKGRRHYKYIDERVLYLAYGSNTSIEQMARRCPAATPLAALTLPAYALAFRRVADAVPSARRNARLPCAAYLLTPACVESLDLHEGVRWGSYVRGYVRVLTEGRVISALTYVKTTGLVELPTDAYLRTIERGYSDWGHDREEIERALQYAARVSEERRCATEEAADALRRRNAFRWPEATRESRSLALQEGIPPPSYPSWDDTGEWMRRLLRDTPEDEDE